MYLDSCQPRYVQVPVVIRFMHSIRVYSLMVARLSDGVPGSDSFLAEADGQTRLFCSPLCVKRRVRVADFHAGLLVTMTFRSCVEQNARDGSDEAHHRRGRARASLDVSTWSRIEEEGFDAGTREVQALECEEEVQARRLLGLSRGARVRWDT